MTTEDYCSFEVSKLLKEKGFNEVVHAYHNIYDKVNIDFNISGKALHLYIPCPTHQMAMKWLREEKDIFIEVEYINQKACGCTIIEQRTGGVIAKWNWDRFKYANKNPLTGNIYEKAANAGIEYVLENLI